VRDVDRAFEDESMVAVAGPGVALRQSMVDEDGSLLSARDLNRRVECGVLVPADGGSHPVEDEFAVGADVIWRGAVEPSPLPQPWVQQGERRWQLGRA
jgi:hypothetical protein